MDSGNVRAGMDVAGSGGERLGTADHLDRNRIKPRRNDPVPAGQARQDWQGEAPSPRGS